MSSATVKSGFWNDSYSPIKNRSPIERGAARVLNRRSMRAVRELMLTLNGAAAGSAALATYKRKTGTPVFGPVSQGGVVEIETVDLVNRVTTAQDVTDINTYILAFPVDQAIPTNGDGNPRGLASG